MNLMVAQSTKQVARHASAGKDFRDGAVVPFV